MTNISKHKLQTNDYTLAKSELTSLIARLNKSSATHLIDDLLTESEQIMIVKRFAAIFMLHNNYSPYRVSQTIAVSISTAQRLYDRYENGDFNRLLKRIKKKDANTFLRVLEDIIAAQVSPQARARLFEGNY